MPDSGAAGKEAVKLPARARNARIHTGDVDSLLQRSQMPREFTLADVDSNRLAPKPLRRCRSASPLPPRAPVLNQAQQALIRHSWHRVPHSSIGNCICSQMSARSDARALFGDSSSADRHTRHFTGLLQCVVDNLHDLESALQPWLETLGKGHTGFAVSSAQWDAFGEAVLNAAIGWVRPGKTYKDTVKAWMLLSSFLADRLGAASRATVTASMSAPRIQLITLMSSAPPSPR